MRSARLSQKKSPTTLKDLRHTFYPERKKKKKKERHLTFPNLLSHHTATTRQTTPSARHPSAEQNQADLSASPQAFITTAAKTHDPRSTTNRTFEFPHLTTDPTITPPYSSLLNLKPLLRTSALILTKSQWALDLNPGLTVSATPFTITPQPTSLHQDPQTSTLSPQLSHLTINIQPPSLLSA